MVDDITSRWLNFKKSVESQLTDDTTMLDCPKEDIPNLVPRLSIFDKISDQSMENVTKPNLRRKKPINAKEEEPQKMSSPKDDLIRSLLEEKQELQRLLESEKTKNQENSELLALTRSLEVQFSVQKLEIQQMVIDLENFEADKKNLIEENTLLISKIAQLEAKLQELSSIESSSCVQKVQNDYHVVTEALEKANSKQIDQIKSFYKGELEKERQNRKHLEDVNQQWILTNEYKKRKIATLEEKIKKLEDEKKIEMTVFEDKFRKLEEEARNRPMMVGVQKIQDLTHEIERLQTRIEFLNMQLGEHEKQEKEWEQKFEHLFQEKLNIETIFKEITSKTKESDETIEKLRQENSSLLNENVTLSHKLTQLKSQLHCVTLSEADLKNKFKNLDQEIRDKDSKFANLEEKYECLKEIYENVYYEKEDLQNHVFDLEGENQSLKNELNEITSAQNSDKENWSYHQEFEFITPTTSNETPKSILKRRHADLSFTFEAEKKKRRTFWVDELLQEQVDKLTHEKESWKRSQDLMQEQMDKMYQENINLHDYIKKLICGLQNRCIASNKSYMINIEKFEDKCIKMDVDDDSLDISTEYYVPEDEKSITNMEFKDL